MTVPAKLGKYEIRRELGQGAMGVVYEGYDPMIGRRVALKTVRRDQIESTEANELLARFRREAQAAGRMTHPNIVAIYEYGEDHDAGGIAFIAMEFVEGRELKDYFDRDERFPLPEVVRIMGQLLDALEYSHRQGVVHRDIKPANIIMLADGTVKVADFGIARIESSNLTQAGSVLGTPSYMSPEQFMGQTVDGRSDLFSAGVVLYQFLTGEKPFTGALTTIMHKVLKEEPPAPSALNVQVPRLFDAIVRRALAKRPDERFQTAREFAAALRGAVTPADATAAAEATLALATDGTVIGGEATQVPGRTAESPRLATASPAVPATAAAPRRSQAPVFAMVAGIAAVGVAALAYFFLQGRTPEPTGIARQAPAVPAQQPVVAAAAPVAPAPPPAAPAEPGTMVITALGLADPSDPRFTGDANSLQIALREDARRQLVEKAVALYVDHKSIDQNYGVLRDRLLARSGEFVQAVIEEQAAQTGKDGLVSIATRATVRVRDIQKTLNQMSREERVEFIRNNGDPRIAVAITVAGGETAAPARSPLAENLLKERILSFGFRVANDDLAAKDGRSADFAVQGEARFKKLSAKLAASGLTIEKTVLTSWTVKCTDKASGEEIYHNTKIPEGKSWASEEKALAEVGHLIGEEFSKSFFLQHFNFVGQPVKMSLTGLPGAGAGGFILRELTALRPVLHLRPIEQAADRLQLDLVVSGGSADLAALLQSKIIAPINQKFGRQCLTLAATGGGEASLAFDAGCHDPAVLSRLESLPPAGLITAPEPRRRAVVRNPETLRKLTI